MATPNSQCPNCTNIFHSRCEGKPLSKPQLHSLPGWLQSPPLAGFWRIRPLLNPPDSCLQAETDERASGLQSCMTLVSPIRGNLSMFSATRTGRHLSQLGIWMTILKIEPPTSGSVQRLLFQSGIQRSCQTRSHGLIMKCPEDLCLPVEGGIH